MAEKPNLQYASFDGLPAICWEEECEAWALGDGQTEWHPVNFSTFAMNSLPLDKKEFDRLFPNLPPLPDEAFKA